MSSPRGGLNAVVATALGIGIAAILLSGVAIYFSLDAMQRSEDGDAIIPTITQPVSEREFYLFSQVDENIDEVELGIPPDLFSAETIVVNQGDSVEIHFFNLEPVVTQEKHSFTIPTGAYQMHHDVNAGEDVEIEFVATEAGVHEYQCVYHMPTMQGKLVVLPAIRQ